MSGFGFGGSSPQPPSGSPFKSAFGGGGGAPQAPPASAFAGAFSSSGGGRQGPSGFGVKSAFGGTGQPAQAPPASAFANAFGAANVSGGPQGPPAKSAFAGMNNATQSPAASSVKSAFSTPNNAFHTSSAFGSNSTPSKDQDSPSSACKSAFGQATQSAQPPPAGAFKSAFGQATQSAQPPPAGAFKSAFGQATQSAQPPPAGAFKSAFGQASTSAAAPKTSSIFGSNDGNATSPQGILGSLAKAPSSSAFGKDKSGDGEFAEGKKFAFGGEKKAETSPFQNPFGQTSKMGTSIFGDAPKGGVSADAGGLKFGEPTKPTGSILGDVKSTVSTNGGFPLNSPLVSNTASAAPAGPATSSGSSLAKPEPAAAAPATRKPEAPAAATTSGAEEFGDTWRCQVCGKVKDLKGAHLNGKSTVRSDCWPCAKKQTFMRGGTKAPAEASAPKSEAVAPTAAPKATVVSNEIIQSAKTPSLFKVPIVPVENAETTCLLKETAADAAASNPVAIPTTSSVDDDTWRCQVCGKVKDLKGAHLNGKSTVRSDCWPCAKKQTFVRGSLAGKPTNTPTVETKTAVNGAPAPTPAVVPSQVFPGVRTSTFKDPVVPKNSEEEKTQVMPAKVAAAPSQPPNSSAKSGDGASVWRCQVCGKVKDLKGPHLNGKGTVRSDCWPCAKKQTFYLDDGSKQSEVVKSAKATSPAEAAAKTAPATAEKKCLATPSETVPSVASAFKSAFGGFTGTAKAPPASAFKSIFSQPKPEEAKNTPTPPSTAALQVSTPTPQQKEEVSRKEGVTAMPPRVGGENTNGAPESCAANTQAGSPPPVIAGATKEELEEALVNTREAIRRELNEYRREQAESLKSAMATVAENATVAIEGQERYATSALQATEAARTAVIEETNKASDRSTEAIENALNAAKKEIVAQVRKDLSNDLAEFRKHLFSDLQSVLTDHFKRVMDREAAESSDYFPGPTDGLRAQSAGTTSHLSNAFRK